MHLLSLKLVREGLVMVAGAGWVERPWGCMFQGRLSVGRILRKLVRGGHGGAIGE